jgi:hypothetical protein
MISLSGPATVYTGQAFTLVSHGDPGAQVQLMEQRFPVDVNIDVQNADSSGKASFQLQVPGTGQVSFYVQQGCFGILFCDKSSTITVSAASQGQAGGGTTIPAPTTSSPLTLAVNKAQVSAGETIVFTVTGPPGMQVDLMWKTLIDQKVASVYLDGKTGQGTASYLPPNQGMKTFYAQQANAICTAALGYLGCKISNDITVTVTTGACEPLDVGCQISQALTDASKAGTGPLADLEAWAANIGKWVVLALVVLLFLYIFLVFILPAMAGKAAGKAAAGASG